LKQPLSFQHYQNWLKKNQHGEMAYMSENQEVRENPQEHFPAMRSMIVFTQDYFPWPHKAEGPISKLKVAHYAQNRDYHFWFKEKLQTLIDQMKSVFPEESFLAFTDAVPLLERDHAAQAALGWVGKNTCLIHPKQGSLFFIGEILTSLSIEQTPEALHDFCGSCRACIEACPTDALDTERVLDSNLCLAYWNIESKGVPPVEIREKMGSWFFGCDICQTVCPWNIKLHKDQTGFVQTDEDPDLITQDLRWILTSSNKAILKEIKETPLSRAGGRGLKRNAMIVAANLKLKNLAPIIESYQDHEFLGELALWALEQIEK
jgi:epoxyqueuosine reductase